MKSLWLTTITTSDNSWTQRDWAPDKSTGLKNSLITTSKSNIVRTRLTEPPMPCLNILSRVLRKKKFFEQKTSKSCTACSFHWPTPPNAFWAKLVTFPPNPRIRNQYFSPAPSFLQLPPKQHSLRRSSRQNQKYEPTTLRTVGQWWKSKSAKSWGPAGRLERCQRIALVPKPSICSRDHPLQGDKSSTQWSSCRAFWYWQDKGVGWPKKLLAKPLEGCQNLSLRIWHLFSFKNRPP